MIQAMALMACRSNNRKQASKLTLTEFREFFELHYGHRADCRCVIAFNSISIDTSVSGQWKNAILIQEVDVFEPEEKEEDDAS